MSLNQSNLERDELEKCRRRIIDLEMRVQDLTSQPVCAMVSSESFNWSTNQGVILRTLYQILSYSLLSLVLQEPIIEEDLSFMDKERLESECKRLKEVKKKADQYAVEAKQTALRLSSENFKLKEDLNKERHHNELTRKSIIKEVEQDVEVGTRSRKLELLRASVFQEEVAERAYQLVQNDPQRGLIYERGVCVGGGGGVRVFRNSFLCTQVAISGLSRVYLKQTHSLMK